jgi:NitT/TauT family transport system ATP-binding protein
MSAAPEQRERASEAVAAAAQSRAHADEPSSAAQAPVKLALRGVRKTFAGAQGATAVLDGIDFDVREGEFCAIVGPSGCGKSTLLNCMAGFEPIDGGSLRVDGAEVREPSHKRVFVFQETGIFPWLDVEQNIGFGLAHLDPRQRRETVERYLRLVGLEGFERAYPAELSGGMKQRVEFARALAVEPDVLFLDEPFGALDAFTRIEMRREILRIWRETGTTCILVTHDVAEALELAGRVAVMSRRPARFEAVFEVPCARPRRGDERELLALRERIFDLLGVVR